MNAQKYTLSRSEMCEYETVIVVVTERPRKVRKRYLKFRYSFIQAVNILLSRFCC